MKSEQVIKSLKEFTKPEDEICIQWYSKTDMEETRDEEIPNEIWIEAVRLFDKWSDNDMADLIGDALRQAEKNVKERTK